jgi:hypothetical protein
MNIGSVDLWVNIGPYLETIHTKTSKNDCVDSGLSERLTLPKQQCTVPIQSRYCLLCKFRGNHSSGGSYTTWDSPQVAKINGLNTAQAYSDIPWNPLTKSSIDCL